MPASGRRKMSTALVLGAVALGMVGLSFASVPLYRLFCQVTGFGGTTRVAVAAPEAVPEAVAGRVFTVRFNSDVGRGMPWRFRPAQREIAVRAGEAALAFYTATNPSDETVLGSATYNVTPAKAGLYFNKVACFCFDQQVLAPGESAQLPVSFFIDPEIVNDRNLDEVTTITLSYTFFKIATRTPDGDLRLSESAAGAASHPTPPLRQLRSTEVN